MGIIEEICRRILVLDGATGTMIQRRGIVGANNEMLNLTDPELIGSIHNEYIAAGADIIETNSFGANRIVQNEFGLAGKSRQMAFESARIARKAADGAGRKIYVAGSMGPTGKSLTLASDASDQCFREYGFDDMEAAYAEQAEALKEGGADCFLVETCFDALNAKAAVHAINRVAPDTPVMISMTVSDKSGRTLTGQTIEAFYLSVRHCRNLIAFGINCALGAEQMEPLAREIAGFSDLPLIFFPNAGIPNQFGRYNDGPVQMATVFGRLAKDGILNIAGGCCGTGPEHIKAICGSISGFAPRRCIPGSTLGLSGLEAVYVDRSLNFTNVGERTNVAGSRKFARLIASDAYDEALQVAAGQIEGGAGIIDINMDDPMVDSKQKMQQFLRHIAGDPSVAKAAIMIDSSHWDTIVEGLKNAQGKCIVNSISLKDGEEEFLRRAGIIRGLGAAVVVMAFDENGQAETFRRKIEICERSYRLLTDKVGFPPQEIIFDCNILSIGTGISGHSRFGVDFIDAVRWIKENLPGAKTSGGVSNLSFAFRGNNKVREAMHSAFLYHAIDAGLDMAIVNPQMLQIYDEIDPELKHAVEDVIFDTDGQATARLVDMASRMNDEANAGQAVSTDAALANENPSERLSSAVVKGHSQSLEQDVLKCLEIEGEAVKVIEGPLMRGMEKVGELFAGGKMFLPQVIKSAKVMRDSVAVLQPFMKSDESGSRRPVFVIATVQGDVHDIGKNITSIVLQCSGFNVIDLGVMVPSVEILEKAVKAGADIIGVSGLITPSLSRMEEICREMAAKGMDTPLFVGGAAASAIHTAARLATVYPDVHYGADASATAVMAKKYIQDPDGFRKSEEDNHARLRTFAAKGESVRESLVPDSVEGGYLCERVFEDVPLCSLGYSELMPYFDWRMFNAVCGTKGDDASSREEAMNFLHENGVSVSLCARFFDCHRDGDRIVSDAFSLPMLRGQRSLADYFPEEGTAQMGTFAVRTAAPASEDLIHHAVCVCLAEAGSKYLESLFKKRLTDGFNLIMPGIGYPCCPDHSLKKDLLALLPEGMEIKLTESCAMIPEASICGLVIAHRDAAYFEIRTVESGYLEEYAARRGMTQEDRRLFLGHLEKRSALD